MLMLLQEAPAHAVHGVPQLHGKNTKLLRKARAVGEKGPIRFFWVSWHNIEGRALGTSACLHCYNSGGLPPKLSPHCLAPFGRQQRPAYSSSLMVIAQRECAGGCFLIQGLNQSRFVSVLCSAVAGVNTSCLALCQKAWSGRRNFAFA